MVSIISWNIPVMNFISKYCLLNIYKPFYVFITNKFVHLFYNGICRYASDK